MTNTTSGLSPLSLRQRTAAIDGTGQHAAFLIGLQRAVDLLGKARSLEESRQARAMAQMAEDYARAEQLGSEATALATEIRVRAARKAGELLAQMKQQRERVDSTDTLSRGTQREPRDKPTLSELGVTKKQAATWQAIARVSDDTFENEVSEGWGENAIAEGERRPRSGPHAEDRLRATSSVPLGNTKRSGLKPSARLRKLADQLAGMAQGLPNLDLRGEDCDDVLGEIVQLAAAVRVAARRLREGRTDAAP